MLEDETSVKGKKFDEIRFLMKITNLYTRKIDFSAIYTMDIYEPHH